MKKIIYILSLVMFFGCGSLKAQNYKTHKVRKKDTVESIAKQYNVSASELLALNPDARKKLKRNSVIIIPNKKITEDVATTAEDETITTITKELDGFKKHRVRRKETLFGLSQKYDITQEEIKKYNKFLYANPLRKGDRLQIPIFKTVIKTEKATTKTHIVKAKEGKWRIAYQYGITLDELEALNPEMGEVLQPGQSINVPNIGDSDVKEIEDKEYSYYTVLPREGFYRLKVKLGVDKATLENLNPNLVETGLQPGMVLKFPLNEAISEEATLITEGNENLEPLNLTNFINDSETKNIAILLPFKLNRVNTDSIKDAKDLIKNDDFLSVSVDFYSGARMALDSLKQLGVNLKVNVLDTKNSLITSSAIAEYESLKTADVVIGPIMPKNFDMVASSLYSKNVPVVSPITKTVESCSNVFQTRPSEKLLKQRIINHFKQDSTAHVVVITDSKNTAISDELKIAFPNASLLSSRKSKKTEKDAFYVLDKDIIDVIKPGKNIVFLETQNDGFVSNVSSILNSKIDKEHKVILTTTNKNKAFEDEEVSNYHLSNLQFTFASISKVFDEETKNSFVKKYEKTYKQTPNDYAVRGFDITMDIILRLVTSKNLYDSVEEAPLTSYVENKFAYKKEIYGGYYNNTVYLIKYDNLKIVEVE